MNKPRYGDILPHQNVYSDHHGCKPEHKLPLKTENDTIPVKVDPETGKLYVPEYPGTEQKMINFEKEYNDRLNTTNQSISHVNSALDRKADNDDLNKIRQELSELRREVDSELSDTSTNPIQNKVITEELGKKLDKGITTSNNDGLTIGDKMNIRESSILIHEVDSAGVVSYVELFSYYNNTLKIKDILSINNEAVKFNEQNLATEKYVNDIAKNKADLSSVYTVEQVNNNFAKKSDISSVYKYKGTYSSPSNIDITSFEEGSVFNISNSFTTDNSFLEGSGINYPAGTNIVKITSEKWDVLSGTFDTSNLQDKLISGENIKTINNESILGNGNIEIQVNVDSALSPTSTNPIQNKVITTALNSKANSSDVYTQTETNSLLADFEVSIHNNFYDKTQVDSLIGDINTILDNINGEVI